MQVNHYKAADGSLEQIAYTVRNKGREGKFWDCEDCEGLYPFKFDADGTIKNCRRCQRYYNHCLNLSNTLFTLNGEILEGSKLGRWGDLDELILRHGSLLQGKSGIGKTLAMKACYNKLFISGKHVTYITEAELVEIFSQFEIQRDLRELLRYDYILIDECFHRSVYLGNATSDKVKSRLFNFYDQLYSKQKNVALATNEVDVLDDLPIRLSRRIKDLTKKR